MVNRILSFFQHVFVRGSYDWLVQPLTTAIMLLYSLTVAGFLLTNSVVSFYDWKAFITSIPMQIATVAFLASVCWHIWSSMQALLIEYLQSSTMRSSVVWIVATIIVGYYVWGVCLVVNT